MHCRPLLLSLLTLGSALFAQTATVNGTISGVVRDPSGSAIANASVAVTNLDTGFRRSVTTDEAGEYQTGLLPLGGYEILVQAPGFADYQQSPIQVSVGRVSTVSPTLEISRERRTVTVTADAAIVQLEKFETGRTFNETSVENNPTPSRNTQNIALLGPGLNGQRDDEFGTTQFAFGGLQRRAFMVDGVDNTQRGGQLRLGIFNIESIQEIQVVSNAMSAEYGRTVGGTINFVTKGGTNDFHGEGLYLARRPGFIARPSLYNTVPGKPFQQWATYAANGGGAIRKDRLSTSSAPSTSLSTRRIRSPSRRPTQPPSVCRLRNSARPPLGSAFKLTWAGPTTVSTTVTSASSATISSSLIRLPTATPAAQTRAASRIISTTASNPSRRSGRA